MINCRFTPIQQWPTKPTASYARKGSPFKAGWQDTLDLLERELNHLRAKEITIEGYFTHHDIRNDGWPKSNARPSQPGVVVRFQTGKGEMSMPCDRFTNWQSNVRAIALTLERLRSVERYGVTTSQQEQYSGWLKLPASTRDDEIAQLALALCQMAGFDPVYAVKVASEREVFDQAWRAATHRAHPDKGGSTQEFNAVIVARDRIKELKGWS